MQRFVVSKKNQITFLNGGFLFLALMGHFLLKNTYVVMGALILASAIGVLPILIQAGQALRVHVISIELLVSIAVIGAFFIQNYEEAAMVTFLFLFGAFLEQRTLTKTRSAIKELTEMVPESAVLQLSDGTFKEIGIDEVEKGDYLLVKTGAKIPVDGTVLSGVGHVNEASITGEAISLSKTIGDTVFAGTILENGTVTIQANKIGEETTFGKIIELVEEAQDSKSETERFIDRFSKYYTPLVLLLGAFVFVVSRNLSLAITILVLGCPGALVIGVPVSNVSGIGNGARNGILLKGSEVVTQFSRVDTIVFDKTGTLTKGNPEVAEQICYGEEEKAYSYLASIEQESDHPLAKAIVAFIGKTPKQKITHTEVIKGGGIRSEINGQQVLVGNEFLMKYHQVNLTEQMERQMKDFEEKGDSIVVTAIDNEVKLLMGIRDTIRPGVKENLKKLKKMRIKNLIVLSGDNQGTVDLIAQELELTQAHGNMLPEEKAQFIERLQKNGQQVAFVGDGVNDSPSLAIADIGIAMGNGTDIAIETSDVVLMNSDFTHLPHALGLSRATAKNRKENIVIAVGVVLFLLGGLLFSQWMNMTIGMLVHEGSIVVVILNAMRLLGYSVN